MHKYVIYYTVQQYINAGIWKQLLRRLFSELIFLTLFFVCWLVLINGCISRRIVTVHGFPVPSSPCLVCERVRMCEQVSVGVCDWGWFAPAESHHRWAISVPVTLSPLSDPCSVCGRRLRSVLVPRFLSPAASWTPIAGPWLPIASLRYPPLPYGKLRFCLRKAPLLPTESSASALRKAPFLPTESSASA